MAEDMEAIMDKARLRKYLRLRKLSNTQYKILNREYDRLDKKIDKLRHLQSMIEVKLMAKGQHG